MDSISASEYKTPYRKKNRFWKPGRPLTEQDRELLETVREVYKKQGFVPSKKEVPNANELKQRFRVWDDVLCAAGLPSLKDPEEKRKRMEAKIQKEE